MSEIPQSPFSEEAVEYAWTEILRRAAILGGQEGLIETFGMICEYGDPAEIIAKRGQDETRTLIVARAPAGACAQLVAETEGQLEWMSRSSFDIDDSCPIDDDLPILFRGEGYERGTPFALRQGPHTIITVDIVAATIFCLCRLEEYGDHERDEHGRFPGSASCAYKHGFLDRPIVDEYGLVLEGVFRTLDPNWTPERDRRLKLRVSHDIDRLRDTIDIKHFLRTVGGDLVKRGSFTSAMTRFKNALRQANDPAKTDQFRAVENIAKLSRELGVLQEAFYFLAGRPSSKNGDYEITAPEVHDLIRRLVDEGHEVGLHASYESSEDPLRLAAESDAFRHVSGQDKFGGRHHYLRFQVPQTWRNWEQTGLSYDSSLGYADYEGFRCGTCHPYKPFDLEENRVLDIVELPLICMDVTLLIHRAYTPKQAAAAAIHLASRCRRVGGEFTLLWHNSSITDDRSSWEDVYRRILNATVRPVELPIAAEQE